MIYELVPDTHPILRKAIEPFDFAGPVDPVGLAENLRETMLAHRGFGLAANQCGLVHRVFVLDNPDGGTPLAFFNPEIIEAQGEIEGREGCLSFPGLVLFVKRAETVSVHARDEHGREFEITLEGDHARGTLHETDHLNGITFTRHVSKFRLEQARSRMKK